MMLKKVIYSFFIITGAIAGFLYGPYVMDLIKLGSVDWLLSPFLGLALGAIIFFILSYFVADYILDFIRWVEDGLIKVPVGDLLFGSIGLVIGLLIAFLVNLSIQEFQVGIISQVVPIFLTIILGYLGFQVGFRRREEFANIANLNRKEKKSHTEKVIKEEPDTSKTLPKVLDTSVIIDGRIADICETGFLEGPIIIPEFVLGELQHIADSSDALKRNRGRRGLDILNRIQKELSIEVKIYDGDFEDIPEVDSKLIKLAKVLNGVLVTNDYNLNKVSDFHGVPVLNINDLANAVKPVVLPGEELSVQVIKDGKEKKQGVAYLDDGTMIVVEEGRGYIGETIEVIITSVLQTSAGRMIFAKPKLLEKAQ